VRRGQLEELHFISPIANVPSILQHGILCHNHARQFEHKSVAMREIQERRKRVKIPGGDWLHEYANLYINARNKMLFKLKAQTGDETLCVLRIGAGVLDLPDVVIADRNASSDHVRFAASPDGLERIERGVVFSRYWTHPEDPIAEMRHGSIMCAEVLVPHRLDPRYIIGAYVSCEQALSTLNEDAPGLGVTINRNLFFR
jgi:hypothetical protein